MSTVAAYRDRWHIEGQRPLGAAPDRENLEQIVPAQKGAGGGERAKAISTEATEQRINPGLEVDVGIAQGLEL